MNSYTEQLILAEKIAREAHAGQFRRDNKTPYIHHVEKVVENLNLFFDESYNKSYTQAQMDYVRCIAWLHDVVEDTKLTFDDLAKMRIYEEIIQNLERLTHKTDYFDYIRELSHYKEASIVKICDILANLCDNPTEKQKAKYAKALSIIYKTRCIE
jgi:(p)ppGpp synthase/HD superfamily hydrolase